MSARKLWIAALLVVFVFGVEILAWPQENRGSITGTVMDTTGAVVPSVSITATDINRGVKYPVVSTSAGVYAIPGLEIGTYRVEATKDGFKTFVEEPVSVITGSVTTANITLEVGAVTQQVTVSASTPLLQTTDAQISYAITNKLYQELPLTMNGDSIDGSGRRQPNQFILLMPGVDTDIEGDTLGRMFNGAQYYQGLFMVDGVATTISIDAGQAEFYAPPYEAMEEFKVQTSNLPAEYGGASGLENLTMKSGTNNYHGDLFWFHRDDALTAKGFSPVTKKSLFIQNETGATFGGPLSLPHLYNGHNRTFFFATFGGFFNVGGPPSTPTYNVPTAAERQGDFSALLGQGITLYDPSTTTFNPATGTYTRQGFPTPNVLKNAAGASEITSQAAYWLKWIAMPNTPGTNGGLIANFRDTVGNNLHDWTWSGKVDHTINDHHKLAYAYWSAYRPATSFADRYFDTPVVPGQTGGGGQRLHDYYSFSANIQNDAYAGYTSYIQKNGVCPANALLGDNPAGIPNLDYYNPGGTGQYRWASETGAPQPISYFRSGAGLQGCIPFGPGNQSAGRNSHIAALGDQVNYLHGKHNIKFGVSGSRELTTYRGIAGGWYQFASQETYLPPTPASPNTSLTTGDAFASFLLGLADGTSINGPNIGIQWHNPRMAAFLQDTWKATNKLSIDYGLRWDRTWITTESYNRVAGFSFTAPNPAAGNIPGADVFLGTGTGRTGTNTLPGVHALNHEFGPRLGFAYQLDPKTVIRTGWALMWTYGNGDAIGFDAGGSPFQNGIIKDSVSTISPDGINSVPSLVTGLPVPTCALPCYNPSFANGGTPLMWDPNSGRDPYIQQWTFGVERYLPAGFFIQAAYVGNKGNNLDGDQDNPDQLPVSDLTTYGTLLGQPLAGNAQAATLGIKAPYAGFPSSSTVGQAIRPFPQFSAIADRFDPSGMNRYDSLQMSLRKQTGDLQTMINFTDAKNLTDARPGAFGGSFAPQAALDTFHLGLEKGLDPLTPRRRFVVTWLYSLPVGKGKRFGTTMPKAADEAIGHWEIGAIQTYRSGYPDAVSGGNPTSGEIFDTETRPNQLSGVPIRLHGCNNISLGGTVLANINAFAAAPATQLGNAPRYLTDFRGCAWISEDFTVQKRFPITEKLHFMFRVDVYNLFNRVKFSDPSLNINSPKTFGEISSNDGYYQPRSIQLSGKFIF